MDQGSDRPSSFHQLLGIFVARAGYSVDDLAYLSQVPEETIKNWLEGKVKRPRNWQDIVRLAQVLHLNIADADQLLRAAQRPSITDLLQQARPGQVARILERWADEIAQHRLAALRGDLPVAAALPPGSRMLIARNPLFVGRQDALVQIALCLASDENSSANSPRTVAVTGIGGLGKTQLAAEFVHHYGQFFAGGVYWVSFADPAAIPFEITVCGGPGFLDAHPDFTRLSLDEQVAVVRAAWESPLPRLLVFDNCEDSALLRRWRPTTGGARVLITSRRASWDVSLGVQTLPLDVLHRPESIALLRHHRADMHANDPVLHALAIELGDLPLALHLAGHYLARYRFVVTPERYLEDLRSRGLLDHPSLGPADESPTGHVMHVNATLALSYARLVPTDPLDGIALGLLVRVACFAPGEAVPRELLWRSLGFGTTDIGTLTRAEDAVERCRRLGLLEQRADGGLRMHRLISAFVDAIGSTRDAHISVEQTVLAQAGQLAEQGDIIGMRKLYAHLRYVTDRAVGYRDERAADLCHVIAYHLWLQADYATAQTYLEQALSIYGEHQAAVDPLKIAETLSLLALVFQLPGRFREARSHFERALRLREQTVGPEHESTIDDVNNLGYLLFLQGDYVRAETYLRRALQVRWRTQGAHHLNTARSLHNMGYLSLKQGKYRSARRYLMLALSIRQQVLSANHLSTAYTLNFLGETLFAQGNIEGARHYHERALAMRQVLFGDEHHDTAESIYNLGRIFHAQGNSAKAHVHFERALAMYLAMVGAKHRDTAFVLTRLGALLREQGQYPEAHGYLNQAIEAWESQGQMQHPELVPALNQVALLFSAQDKLTEARTAVARALDICRDTLGEGHPDMAYTLATLGIMLNNAGERGTARRHFEDALTISSTRLGPDHPLTFTIRAHLNGINAKP